MVGQDDTDTQSINFLSLQVVSQFDDQPSRNPDLSIDLQRRTGRTCWLISQIGQQRVDLTTQYDTSLSTGMVSRG